MMNDKVQHFIAGCVLSMLGVIFFPLILLGFIFGVGKELWDKLTGRGVADLLDMIATFCGAAIASLIVLVVI